MLDTQAPKAAPTSAVTRMVTSLKSTPAGGNSILRIPRPSGHSFHAHPAT